MNTPKTVLPKLAVGEREAAQMLGVSDRTLWTLRQGGKAPPHVRLGHRVVYPVAGLLAFLNASTAATPLPSVLSSELNYGLYLQDK